MPYAPLANGRIHYQMDGKAGQPVLVLSNSLGATIDMWAPQVDALAEHFQVLRYDTRGHGLSDAPPGPYTIAMLGGDVLGLLDHLKIQRAHFCGLSMGGITGMWLATEHADRLERLVLCNTAAQIGPPENWTARADTVRTKGMQAIAEPVVAKWLTPDYAAQHPDLVTRLQAMLLGADREGYAANCYAVRDADFRAAVKQIALPTLVIAGKYDMPTPPANTHYLAEVIPDASYVELDAAHISNLEQPERFTAAVLGFLDSGQPASF